MSPAMPPKPEELTAELEQLRRERARDRDMLAKGMILAPWGGWIPRSTWAAHMKRLRDSSGVWAP